MKVNNGKESESMGKNKVIKSGEFILKENRR